MFKKLLQYSALLLLLVSYNSYAARTPLKADLSLTPQNTLKKLSNRQLIAATKGAVISELSRLWETRFNEDIRNKVPVILNISVTRNNRQSATVSIQLQSPRGTDIRSSFTGNIPADALAIRQYTALKTISVKAAQSLADKKTAELNRELLDFNLDLHEALGNK